MLALGLALSACGLQGLKNPAPASTSGSTTAPASVLEQFAGGVAGAGSSDGNTQVSRFAYAQGVVNDGHGRVYVTDTGNHTIRMLTSTGSGSSKVWTTVTIAGVAGTSGFTDTITDSSGAPVAGSKPALFDNPIGLAIDPSAATDSSFAGTILYVADFGNNTIRKIVLSAPATGTTPVAVVTTIAGVPQVVGNVLGVGSVAEFNGPVGLAFSSARQELYVTDSGNNELRRINLVPSTTNACGIIKPPTDTTGIYEPLYNVTLLAGHASVTSSTGASDSSSGSLDGDAGLAGFAGPEGIVVDATGVIYVTDTRSNLIRKIKIAQFLYTPPASSDPEAPPPVSVLKDTCGSSSYGTVSTLSGVKTNIGGADDDFYTTTVLTLTYNSTDPTDPSAVQRKVDVTKTMGTVTHPGASTVQPSVITYQYNQTAKPVGTVETSTSVVASTPKYNNPTALVVDGNGNLLITDSDNNVIRQYDMTNKVLSTVVGIPPTTLLVGASNELVTYPGTDDTDTVHNIKARVNHPRGITYDSSTKMLFLADSGNSRVREITDDGSWTVTTIGGASTGFSDGAGAAAGFNSPRGIGFDSAGNAYVADSGNNSIRRIDSGGNVTTFAGLAGDVGSFANGIGSIARFNSPSGLVVDAGSGKIYVADTGNNCIRVLDSAGNVSVLAGSSSQTAGSADGSGGSGSGGAATFRRPTGLALDGQGNLYVADSGNNTIRRITLATAQVQTVAGVAGSSGVLDGATNVALFNNPQGLVASGNLVYVADTDNSTIRRITLSTGMVDTLAGTAQVAGSIDSVKSLINPDVYDAALFNKPTALVLDGSGTLFVADHDNQTLRKVVPGTNALTTPVTTVAGLAGASGFIAGYTPGLLAFPAGLATKGSTLYITMSDSVVTMTNLP